MFLYSLYSKVISKIKKYILLTRGMVQDSLHDSTFESFHS